MKWSGEQYKCRKCGEVYPYRLSTCSCGGVCDKIADAPQESSSGLNSNISVLADILEVERQKEQERKQKEREKIENALTQLYDAVKDACSKNDYAAAISYLERILGIAPESMDAQKLLDYCKNTLEEQRLEKVKALSIPGDKAGERKIVIVNGVEFAFRWCPAGTFMMGSPESEKGRDYRETQHCVTLSKGFWMMETQVTQKQWIAVMGANPSYFKGDDLPVEGVSWNDCQEFCKKCTQLGLPVQLPTEAQWEYACRAGSTTAYFWGNALNSDKAKFNSKKTMPVGSYEANAWGLYDMHGNVWEWCLDWYGDYPNRGVTDPVGPSNGVSRVLRGGSWYYIARFSRSACRYANEPNYRDNYRGFRVVKNQ